MVNAMDEETKKNINDQKLAQGGYFEYNLNKPKEARFTNSIEPSIS